MIGDAAKNQVAMNPNNTVFDAKRLIGRDFNDSTVQKDMKHWPFQVANVSGKPKIQVEFKCENKTFTPEEVSSMVPIIIFQYATMPLLSVVSPETCTGLEYRHFLKQAIPSSSKIVFLSVATFKPIIIRRALCGLR